MIVAAVFFVAVLALVSPRTLTGALSFALAGWVIGSSVVDAIRRRKMRALNAGAVAVVLAHAGLGVTLMGVAGVSLWRIEVLEVLAPDETVAVGPYTLRFDGVASAQGPNYQAARADIGVLRDGREIAQLHPEQRLYPAEGQQVANTAIRTTGVSDLYIALGDDRGNGRWTIRAYFNPFAPFIWFGGAIMALGGMASLFGRLRRTAPATTSDVITVTP
jgi:cytochrome c-type biogenesis protein CcmF